jgi:ABC-type antimicrobial peptide transport system permease subunit
VSQRSQEFGVRMALGAEPGAVRRLVLGEGLKLTALGGAIGLGLSLACARLVSGFLYGVSPFDAATFLSVAGVLGVIATLACLIPAHRATRVSPCEALRVE